MSWEAVDLHAEVVFEEEEADDGEEVHEEDGEHGGEDDGAAVARHTLDDIEQRLLADHQVKQLVGEARYNSTPGQTAGRRGTVQLNTRSNSL